MAIPTTNAAQELPAINQILASVGQAPVTTLDQTNPDVAIAYDTLIQVSREIQSEGWTFNTEQDYPFTPDSNNEILIPSNVLQIDISAETGNEEIYDANLFLWLCESRCAKYTLKFFKCKFMVFNMKIMESLPIS